MAANRVPSHVPQSEKFTSPLRHYTGMWCLFVAALPVVVTRFGLIPVYESQKNLLPAYASFFCLLALAYVFSQRHRLARAMFAARLLWTDLDAVQSKKPNPLSINGGLAGMILGALGCAALYLWAFEGGRTSRDFPALPPSSMNAVLLALSFITLFLLASGAFAIVAVREHMQRVLGLSDAEVITGLPRSSEQTTNAAEVTGLPRSVDQTTSTAPSAARHGGIAILSERGGVRGSATSGNEEGVRSDEPFKSESDISVRALTTDSARF
jgi:hypothetical protein